jgi:general secretion pathway protein L
MDAYSNSVTRQLVNAGTRFRRWTSACVAAFVEDLAGPAGNGAAGGPMIAAYEDRFEIFGRASSGKRELLARVAATDPAGLRSALGKRSHKTVVLRVGGGRAIVKRIVLPAGALDVLPAVVRNKVESLAPWPLAEAIWGHRAPELPQAGQLAVDVGIASRKTIDGILSVLKQAGAVASHLEIAGENSEADGIAVDLLKTDRTRGARRLVTALMTVAALLALATFSYGLFRGVSAQLELSATEQRTAETKQLLLGRGSTGEAGSRLAEANKIYDRKKDTPPFVALLNSLTRLVPDGIWLTGIDYSGGRLTVTGRGTQISGMIGSLEKSELFADVNFASATQRDPEQNTEIFSISATIDPNGAAP